MRLLAHILFFFVLAFPSFGQTVGGAGWCKTSVNPNTIASLRVVNQRNMCSNVWDTLARKMYYYDYSLTVGSRWVEFVPLGPPIGAETKVEAGTGIGVSGNGTVATPYIISNTGDLSSTNELQYIDTLLYSSDTLRLSLSLDGRPQKKVYIPQLPGGIYGTPDTTTGNHIATIAADRTLTFRAQDDDAGGIVPFRITSTGNEPDILGLYADGDSLVFGRADTEMRVNSSTGLLIAAANTLALQGDSVQVQTLPTAPSTEKTYVVQGADAYLRTREGVPLSHLTQSGATTGQVVKWNGTAWVADASVGATDLTYSGTSSPVTLNSSTGTDVTTTAGTGISLAATSGNLTITNTGDTNPSDDITGSGTTNYVPKFTSAQVLGNSQLFDNGTSVGVGNSGTFLSGGRLEVDKAYTNTSDANIVVTGSIPSLSIRNSNYRFTHISNYSAGNKLTLLGNPSPGDNPTSALMEWDVNGDVQFFGTKLFSTSARVNAAATGSSFGASAAPSGVSFYANIPGGERFRIQGNSGLSYTDFYTPASGSNRNYSFATSYYNPGDFVLLRSSAAGVAPTENVWAANSTGFGINTGSPSQLFHVAGGNFRNEGAYYDSNNDPGSSAQILSSTVTGTDWVAASTLGGGGSSDSTWVKSDGTFGSDTLDNVRRTGKISLNTTSTEAMLNLRPKNPVGSVLTTVQKISAPPRSAFTDGIFANNSNFTALELDINPMKPAHFPSWNYGIWKEKYSIDSTTNLAVSQPGNAIRQWGFNLDNLEPKLARWGILTEQLFYPGSGGSSAWEHYLEVYDTLDRHERVMQMYGLHNGNSYEVDFAADDWHIRKPHTTNFALRIRPAVGLWHTDYPYSFRINNATRTGPLIERLHSGAYRNVLDWTTNGRLDVGDSSGVSVQNRLQIVRANATQPEIISPEGYVVFDSTRVVVASTEPNNRYVTLTRPGTSHAWGLNFSADNFFFEGDNTRVPFAMARIAPTNTLTANTTGRIGIGLSSAYSTLDIQQHTNGLDGSLRLVPLTGDYAGLFVNSDNELSFNRGGANRMFLTNAGQLRLATYTSTSSYPITAAGVLGFNSAGEIGTVAGITGTGSGAAGQIAVFDGASSIAGYTSFTRSGSNIIVGPPGGDHVEIKPGSSGIEFFDAGNVAGNLYADGSVLKTDIGMGISGNSTIAGTLDVSGSITTSAHFRAPGISSGNAGIGTTPSGTFNAFAPNGTSPYITFSEAGVANRGAFGFPAGSGDFVWSVGNQVLSSGTERMRLTSGGNLGVGVTPSEKLHVSGNIRADGTLKTRGTGTTPTLYLENTTASTGKEWYISSGNAGSLFIGNPTTADVITINGTTGATTIANTLTVSTATGTATTVTGRTSAGVITDVGLSGLSLVGGVLTATGGATDLTFSGSSSPVTLNSSTGTDVTFTAGGINAFSATSGNITITATEVDGSVTNELQTYGHSGTTSYTNTLSNSGGSFTLQPSGIVTVSNSSGTVTIGATEVDGSITNELQTIANTSDATSHTATLSNSGGSIQFVEGSGITMATTGTSGAGILTVTAVDASTTNELQTYSHAGTTTYTNTLSNSGGSWSITGAGIAVISQTAGAVTVTATEVDGSISNEGSLTVGAGTGTTSIINSNTSGSTGVTLTASTGLSISESGNVVTLTNSSPDQTVSITNGGGISVSGTYPSFTLTATDQSTTNEVLTISDGTNSEALGGQTLTVAGGGINVASYNTGTNTLTITGTEVDGSVTNELQTFVNTSDATSHTVTLSNSGGSIQLVEGSGVTLTTSGTSGDGVVTIAAAGGGTNYQTFRDDGSNMTQQPAANFVSSGTVAFTLTNDGGNTETEIAAAVPTDGITATEIAAGAVGASELASTAVTPGSYLAANVTVDADGRITAASSGSIAYQTLRDDGVDKVQRFNVNFVSTPSVNAALTDDGGNNETEVRMSVATDGITATEIAAGAVGASELSSLGTAGTYGSATQVPVFTTDADGRVSAVTNTSITGTLSGLTATRVPFASSATALTDDANLTWENTNKRLSIGNTGGSPAASLHIAEGSVASWEPLRAVGTVSGNMTTTISNAQNSGGASNNLVDLSVGGASAGDAAYRWLINGVDTWSMGIDNSDADKWKLKKATTPSTGSNVGITMTADATPLIGINNDAPLHPLHVIGRATATVLQGISGTPTHTFGAGAGTGPSLGTLTGCTNGFNLQITIGTTPTVGGNIVSVTFPTAFSGLSFPTYSCGNDQTALENAAGKFVISAASATALTIKHNALTPALNAGDVLFFRFNTSGR